MIKLRAYDHQSYIDKSKNDSDFDWYYSTHGDKKIDKHRHHKKIKEPKHKHMKKKRS
jgi:hypothetical protein